MAKEKSGNLLGSWSFLIGVVLAILVGFFGSPNSIVTTYALVFLGLIIGFLNISNREAHSFMVSGAVLVLVATLGQTVLEQIKYVNTTLESLVSLFVPATIIVVLRHVFSTARR